jgi:Ca2+-binding RTX toxin-like protein
VTLFQKYTSDGKRDNLFVTVNGANGSYEIEIYDQFDDPYEGIEAIEFADGERWTLSDIQANTWLTGTNGANSYNGLSVRDNIRGLDGNDTLKGLGGDDHLHGDAGDDVLEGGDGNDTLFGGDGNDTLNGGLGEDALFGGAGDDTLIGHADADSFDGGEGIDTVDFTYSTRNFTIDLATEIIDWSSTTGGIESIINVENVIGSSGDNTIIGDGADNRIEGRDGNDTIDGGAGDDVLIGGDGNDLIYGGDGSDTIYLDKPGDNRYGTDTAHGGDGDDAIYGVNGSNTIYGDAGDDYIPGGNDLSTADVDYLYGGDGNDTIVSGQTTTPSSSRASWGDQMFGEAGDDTITGGKAEDTIVGGAGNDTLVFNLGDGQDQITDFQNGSDLLDFTNTALSFADLIVTTNGTSTLISYDNGQQIELLNPAGQIGQDDFIFT